MQIKLHIFQLWSPYLCNGENPKVLLIDSGLPDMKAKYEEQPFNSQMGSKSFRAQWLAAFLMWRQLSKWYRFTSHASRRQCWYSTLGGTCKTGSSSTLLVQKAAIAFYFHFCFLCSWPSAHPWLIKSIYQLQILSVHIGNRTERFWVLGNHCLSINILSSYQKIVSLSTWSWKLHLPFTTKKTDFYMFLDFWKRNLSREKKEGQSPWWQWKTNSAQLRLFSTPCCPTARERTNSDSLGLVLVRCMYVMAKQHTSHCCCMAQSCSPELLGHCPQQ